jgi:hypothetical protein
MGALGAFSQSPVVTTVGVIVWSLCVNCVSFFSGSSLLKTYEVLHQGIETSLGCTTSVVPRLQPGQHKGKGVQGKRCHTPTRMLPMEAVQERAARMSLMTRLHAPRELNARCFFFCQRSGLSLITHAPAHVRMCFCGVPIPVNGVHWCGCCPPCRV